MPENRLLKFIISIVFSFFLNHAKGQIILGPDSAYHISNFVKLIGEVKLVDSQYILILKLSVENGDTIYVDKEARYDQGENSARANRRLYLAKRIRNAYAQIYTIHFKHFWMNPDSHTRIPVVNGKPIVDTVVLDDLYPFEIGSEYRINIEFDYWQGHLDYVAEAYNITFKASHLPKNSIYN